MKKLAPLFLVLLAAALWGWAEQRARTPRMIPTRENCSIHGVHLGADEAEVLQLLGKPDLEEPRYPKGRERVTVCRWRIERKYEISILQVCFESRKVIAVDGAWLELGRDAFRLEDGQPLRNADFLGSPLSAEEVPLEDRVSQRNGLLTTWAFPGLTLQVLSDESHVDRIFLREPRRAKEAGVRN